MSSQLYAKILKLSTKKLRIQMKAITASVDGVSLSLCYCCLTCKFCFFLSVSFIILLNKQDEANKVVEFYLHIKFPVYLQIFNILDSCELSTLCEILRGRFRLRLN